jgi:Outer membrane lipoprotein carrier protein LolA-like
MISGQASVALLWFTLSSSAAIANQPGPDVDSLLAALAREPPQSIAFTEIHSSALLDRELIVHGTLEYSGPGKLSRIITAPYEERIDIDGDSVRIHRADRPERRFSLKRAPELGGLLAGFAALLGGDRAAVEREFELTLANGTAGWQLTLTPRSARARSRVMGIVVHGTGDAPACIVTLTKDSGAATELLLGAAATGSDIAEQRANHCTASP